MHEDDHEKSTQFRDSQKKRAEIEVIKTHNFKKPEVAFKAKANRRYKSNIKIKPILEEPPKKSNHKRCVINDAPLNPLSNYESLNQQIRDRFKLP